MDIQRTLLIGVTLLLSFMLLTEWVNFKAEKSAPAAMQERLTAAQDAPLPAANAAPINDNRQ